MKLEERIKELEKVIYQTRCELELIRDIHTKKLEDIEIADELIYWLEKILYKGDNNEKTI